MVLLAVVATDSVWMPTWTYFIALGFGASAMLPMSLVYAISGYSMEVGIFNELVYGCECLLLSNVEVFHVLQTYTPVSRHDPGERIKSPPSWPARLPYHIWKYMV